MVNEISNEDFQDLYTSLMLIIWSKIMLKAISVTISEITSDSRVQARLLRKGRI